MDQSFSLHHLSKQELIAVVQRLQKKHKFDASALKQMLNETRDIRIPFSIFSEKLSALETICKFLKENMRLNLHQIGQLLNRDDRTIWTTYTRACQKLSQPLSVAESVFSIPAKRFAQRTLSVLETLVCYLKEQHDLTYKEISALLHRDERTIWTVYQRVRKKQ
jgi:DNA-directed RNA polymerase specialized sigma24 family protein